MPWQVFLSLCACCWHPGTFLSRFMHSKNAKLPNFVFVIPSLTAIYLWGHNMSHVNIQFSHQSLLQVFKLPNIRFYCCVFHYHLQYAWGQSLNSLRSKRQIQLRKVHCHTVFFRLFCQVSVEPPKKTKKIQTCLLNFNLVPTEEDIMELIHHVQKMCALTKE